MIEKLKLKNQYTIIEVEDKINEIIDYINNEDAYAMGITNKYEENESIYISDQMIKDIHTASSVSINNKDQEIIINTSKIILGQKGYKLESSSGKIIGDIGQVEE